MLSKEVMVNCITDENVKWATYLVQTSNNYASSVRIKHNGYDMNAKSLLGVLSLKLSNGEVTRNAKMNIVATNFDAAMQKLNTLSDKQNIEILKLKFIDEFSVLIA